MPTARETGRPRLSIPASYILYVPLVETCTDYSWTPRSAAEIAAGGDDIHFAQRPRPDGDGKFGRIEAINLATGRVLWIHRQRAPLASSLLATQGGLVFVGALDRFFSAYDAATGKLLWQTQLNAAPNSSPVTYSVQGEQYVAVVAGGGGPLSSASASLTPEIDQPPGRHNAVGVQVALALIRVTPGANRVWRTSPLPSRWGDAEIDPDGNLARTWFE
jgi:alcohol dehydrogenase (cytochrome c)